MSDEYEESIEGDDVEESESAEYSTKSDFSKGAIAFQAVQKCIEARGKEMRAGFENVTVDKGGNMLRTKVPDSRKAFISSVEALKALLNPEWRRDKSFLDFYKRWLGKKKTLFQKYAYTEQVKILDKKTGVISWKDKEGANTYMPEQDAILMGNNPTRPNSPFMTPIKGLWDNNVNCYWNDMVKLYDSLFSQLNSLLDRLNYFKQKASF
jgi:hypothetical protein